MSFIPGNTGTTSKAVDGIEGSTAGSPLSLPSGFTGQQQKPVVLSDANQTLTSSQGLVSINPTATRTITLPSTGISAGHQLSIINLSASFQLQINASGGQSVALLGQGITTLYATTSTPTLAAHWTTVVTNKLSQGGDSFGATYVLGSNDNFGINFKTNNTVVGSVSSTGAWTFGPSAGLQNHTVKGFLQVSTDGVLDGFYSPLTAVRPSSATGPHLTLIQRGVYAWGLGVDQVSSALRFGATLNENTFTNFGFISTIGAWTFGPVNYSGSHTFNVGDSATSNHVNFSSRGGNNLAPGLYFSGTNGSGVGIDSAIIRARAGVAGLIFATNSSNNFGQYDSAGSWTFGPSSFTGFHIFNGTALANDVFTGTVSNASNFYRGSFQLTSSGLSGKAFIGLNNIGGGGGCGFVFTRDGSAGTSVQVFTNTTGGPAPGGLNTPGPYVPVGGTDWVASSDERLKNLLGPLNKGLNEVLKLNPISYTLKADTESRTRIGFSAQEVELILPELVNSNTDGYLGLEYSKFAPVLVKAIQELNQKLEAAEARIATLEGGV